MPIEFSSERFDVTKKFVKSYILLISRRKPNKNLCNEMQFEIMMISTHLKMEFEVDFTKKYHTYNAEIALSRFFNKNSVKSMYSSAMN